MKIQWDDCSQSDSTVCRVLALYTPDLGAISGFPLMALWAARVVS